MELNKLQRLACLAINGATRTTLTAPIEVLLGLPSLLVIIEAEAKAAIYRLMCNRQQKPKSTNNGHTKKSWEWSMNPSYLWGQIK